MAQDGAQTLTTTPQEAPVSQPRIHMLPVDDDGFRQAIVDGGGRLVQDPAEAEAVVVPYGADPQDLVAAVEHEGIRWVQLPSAGIEAFAESMRRRPDIAWTSAKGAYANPVGEHALALTLALLRELPRRVVARSWAPRSGRSLHGMRAVVVGAGGIGRRIMDLLHVFDVEVTAVRRRPEAVAEADRTVGVHDLPEILPFQDVVIVAAALTEDTHHLIGRAELESMRTDAILVNIARGGLIDTEALVAALEREQIAGAALDVTDPEPLPDSHPLWEQQRCLITPHTADTMEMIRPLIFARIERNLRAFAADDELEGVVDPQAGY